MYNIELTCYGFVVYLKSFQDYVHCDPFEENANNLKNKMSMEDNLKISQVPYILYTLLLKECVKVVSCTGKQYCP